MQIFFIGDWHYMQIASNGDNLNEMSNPGFWENKKTISVCCLLHITKTRLFKHIENLTSKKWNFSDKKKSYIFQISTQNIDCGYSLEPPRRGGSNEYPKSMFWRRNKKNNVYPSKPQFYYIKVGFKGVKII